MKLDITKKIWVQVATGADDKVTFRLLENGYGKQRTYSEAKHRELILLFCQKQIYNTIFLKIPMIGIS